MFNISQLCERTATLQMIECTRFRGSLCLPFSSSSCVRVLQVLYTRPCQPSERATERRGRREGVWWWWWGEASTEDMVPTREAHRASVPSLQLRALIRLIVSNIETHNKHNTWRPFAILISPSQPARTTQLRPSGISLI